MKLHMDYTVTIELTEEQARLGMAEVGATTPEELVKIVGEQLPGAFAEDMGDGFFMELRNFRVEV